jgi:hypothetical protein
LALYPARAIIAVARFKETAHGIAVPGTEILIDASELSSDVEGMTVKDYATLIS